MSPVECGIQYCSLECYKDDRHQDCSETFFKKEVEEVLRSDMVETEDKKKMIEILNRDKEERAADLLPEELLEADHFEDYSKDDLLSQLTEEERGLFEKAIKDNSIVAEISSNLELWWKKSFKVIPDDAPELRSVPPLSDKMNPHWTTPLYISNLCIVYCFIFRRYLGEPEDLLQESTDELLSMALCFRQDDSDPEQHLFSIFELMTKESDYQTALMAIYDSVEILQISLKVRCVLSHITSLLARKGLSKTKRLASRKVDFYHSWVLSNDTAPSVMAVKLFYLDKKRQIDSFAQDKEKLSSELGKLEISEVSDRKLIDEIY